MDIVRAPKKKTGRNIAIGVGAIIVILAGIVAVARLDPASPTVDRSTLLGRFGFAR